MGSYHYAPFDYVKPPALDGRVDGPYPVLIVGAGPIGLAAAIDLALHGIKSVVLDDNNVVSIGSRAICWSKRTLEIFDRLGVGERMVEKGITWQVGRLFHRDREVYSFDLLPEDGHKMPAFINLQQYYVEQFLVERARAFPDLIELRWKNKVCGVTHEQHSVLIDVETPDGNYELEGQYLLACDGVKSLVRNTLGLDFAGKVFEERFLIADIEMKADFPSERWFWFEPPFHAGQSALLHKQPDNIYRIDLQLGWEADPDEEKKPENVIPRIKAFVGDRDFEIDWVSVYTFQCRRLDRFVHNRVMFVGDSAHIVSPFGARGGNGGVQDVDNLVWKLAFKLKGQGGPGLIESYNEERVHGADENILNSSRATNFMTPKSETERCFRDCVLDLASDMQFARQMVNSGRLSQPCNLEGLSLQTPDDVDMAGSIGSGSVCADAPVIDASGCSSWFLEKVGGASALVVFEDGADSGKSSVPEGVIHIVVGERSGWDGDTCFICDRDGLLRKRYGGGRGSAFLVRPDQHVAARFRSLDHAAVNKAYQRSLGFQA